MKDNLPTSKRARELYEKMFIPGKAEITIHLNAPQLAAILQEIESGEDVQTDEETCKRNRNWLIEERDALDRIADLIDQVVKEQSQGRLLNVVDYTDLLSYAQGDLKKYPNPQNVNEVWRRKTLLDSIEWLPRLKERQGFLSGVFIDDIRKAALMRYSEVSCELALFGY